jgi:CDP-glycerol glycerophosphotransferase
VSFQARIKILVAKVIRGLLHVFWLLPLQRNRVCYLAYGGTQFACNPKYIFADLLERYGDQLEHVWVLPGALPDYPQVEVVRHNSLAYFRCLLTSKVFISNGEVSYLVPFRPGQLVVNTWHAGGAYKRMGGQSEYVEHVRRLSYRRLSYFISSCRRFSQAVSEDLGVDPEKVLPIGLPRNDLFFADCLEPAKRARRALRALDDTGVVLFAPTYRPDGSPLRSDLDLPALLAALEQRFGKPFQCWLRGHYSSVATLPGEHRDASFYPDVQELLAGADVLITDYSSAMWDFSLAGKPCFIYAPDAAQYATNPGFHTPMSEWPFPIAGNSAELAEKIAAFDADQYARDVAAHHEALGSYERGMARRSVRDILVPALGLSKKPL